MYIHTGYPVSSTVWQDFAVDNNKNFPASGQDYPKTWSQFLEWFSTDEACLQYLEGLRWRDGFVCPQCGVAGEPYRASRSRLMCRACRYQGTVTSGTIFDKTRTPLKVWLAAAWYVTNQKHGVSALGLQRVLGLGSYQTAWTMLHRFRRAMVRPGRESLKGTVEVDETFIAITDRKRPVAKVGRKNNTTKTLVAIAVETLEPKGFGRIRLRRIPDNTEQYLLPFVTETVEPGATVHTDGLSAYLALPKYGYLHKRTVMLGSEIPAHISMPGVHRVASLIKRWLLGTHHGAVQPEQLDAYLDEFAFRFNRRTSNSRGLLFYRLLEQAVMTKPATYEEITKQPKSPVKPP
jgi:transposase-like protein